MSAGWNDRLLDLPGVAVCRECDKEHEACFSHFAQFGGDRVYAVVCERDGLTDYYTGEVVRVVERSVITTRSSKALALRFIARSYGLPDRWHEDKAWTGQEFIPTRMRWSVRRVTSTGHYEVVREVEYL